MAEQYFHAGVIYQTPLLLSLPARLLDQIRLGNQPPATVPFQSLKSSEANLFWAQRACKSEPLLLHGSRRFYGFFGQRFLRGKLRNDDDVSDYARGSQRCLGRKDRTRPRIEKIATIGHDLKAVLISDGI